LNASASPAVAVASPPLPPRARPLVALVSPPKARAWPSPDAVAVALELLVCVLPVLASPPAPPTALASPPVAVFPP
jgi:hypothetical protein